MTITIKGKKYSEDVRVCGYCHKIFNTRAKVEKELTEDLHCKACRKLTTTIGLLVKLCDMGQNR